MWRAGSDLPFEVDRPVAERRGRFGRPGGQGGRQVLGPFHAAHPPPAATGGRLDEEREADPASLVQDPIYPVRPIDQDRLQGSRDDRHAGLRGDPSRGELVAERGDRPVVRPDEDEPRPLDRLREGGTLREEAVAGMDGLGAGRHRRGDDGIRQQVALCRRRRSEPDGDVGGPDVGRAGVSVAVDRDRLHPELVTGPDDAQGDLAAVGDEDAPEGRAHPTARPRSVFAQRRRPARKPQSGMLPCFFRGLTSRLSLSIANAAMRRGRVSDGTMTSST